MEFTNRPLDVIAMCSANGDISPLRLRIETEDHQLLRIDIEEVVSSKEIQYAGIEAIVFFCRAIVCEKSWFLELKYTFRTHNWCLVRRVC